MLAQHTPLHVRHMSVPLNLQSSFLSHQPALIYFSSYNVHVRVWAENGPELYFSSMNTVQFTPSPICKSFTDVYKCMSEKRDKMHRRRFLYTTQSEAYFTAFLLLLLDGRK